jgi:DNA polymerase-3 subunit delta'
MSESEPRLSPKLHGHGEALAQMLADFNEGTLAHGWLISGARGTGKATLAYHFARAALSGEMPEFISPDHPVFRRVAALSHADLLVVEPKYDEKKDEKAREISVEQAREIAQFLSLTAGESAWRVVIIDAVDELNVNGANAILKILEEPPKQSVILLISHNPGRLLPTIRSRCRSLRLKPLANNAFNAVMRQVAPEVDSEELVALAALSNGSPGVALQLHEAGALAIYEDILHLLSALPALDAGSVHRFAEGIGTGKVHGNWRLFTHVMLCLLERITLAASGAGLTPVSDEEGMVLQGLSQLHPAGVWAGKWQQVAEQFLLAEKLHLDYKQVIIVFIHSLLNAEGFQIGSAAA